MFCWRKFEICQFHDQIIDGFECFCKVIKFKKHEAKIENDINNTKQISSNGVISADIDIDLLEKRGVY